MELTEGPIWKIPGSTWKSIKERISKRISKNRIEKIMNLMLFRILIKYKILWIKFHWYLTFRLAHE